MSHREVEAKAATYVLEGRVVVETVIFDDDGLVVEALGFVTNDDGDTWMVHIDGDETTCNCPYGIRQDAGGHAHDIAIRVAAMGSYSTNGNYSMREEQ